MNRKILGLALAVSGLTISTGSQAALTIDDFSVDTSSPAFIGAPGTQTTVINSDFSVNRGLSITSPGPATASISVFGDVLGIDTGRSTTSDSTASYSNAGGFDFTQTETLGSIFNTFAISLLSIDQGGVDVSLIVDGVSSTQSVNSIGDIFFAHSLFGDVSSVNSIVFDIHNNAAVDASFDILQSFGSQQVVVTPPTVPEPTSLVLMGLGLGFMGFARKRKQT